MFVEIREGTDIWGSGCSGGTLGWESWNTKFCSFCMNQGGYNDFIWAKWKQIYVKFKFSKII